MHTYLYTRVHIHTLSLCIVLYLDLWACRRAAQQSRGQCWLPSITGSVTAWAFNLFEQNVSIIEDYSARDHNSSPMEWPCGIGVYGRKGWNELSMLAKDSIFLKVFFYFLEFLLVFNNNNKNPSFYVHHKVLVTWLLSISAQDETLQLYETAILACKPK